MRDFYHWRIVSFGFLFGGIMFDRLLKIISKDDFNNIKKLKILIVGIGGVGGYTLETLARIGVQNITIVDNDIVDITNLNRQIIALHLDINPNINLSKIAKFITKDNIHDLDIATYDYIVDACDTVSTKVELIKVAQQNNIKIISIMGTGNKFDPTKLAIIDIYKTNYDPLAKVMRHLLKQEGIKKLTVVASNELPVKTDSIPGSTSLVPSVAGIYAASFIINDVIKRNK